MLQQRLGQVGWRAGPIATSTVRAASSAANWAAGRTLSSTSRSSARPANSSIRPGAACSANRLDGGHPQQPPAVAGLADLAHGAVLQTEDLDGAAGQPQPAGGEREAGGRCG